MTIYELIRCRVDSNLPINDSDLIAVKHIYPNNDNSLIFEGSINDLFRFYRGLLNTPIYGVYTKENSNITHFMI